MSYLVDTNVLTEGFKRYPDPFVVEWLDTVAEDTTYVSAITLGELRKGIDQLPTGRRRANLEAWLVGGLTPRFEGRILAVDDEVADVWGRTLARCRNGGRPVDPIDAQIAATALCHDLTVVTRSVRDFAATGVELLNPFSDDG
ncbi:type II toxin-antitoxin system VapC family toxin [Jiangella asiatica]|uniref:Ribonuclease VapC n=1 Tax=Jiangella asiatica TaxID=2530372 RepID=A0A4R5DGN3_9ACTN|nr:type II toxin-antitoxin system VapC family toxin [Jiangella asiatica]TDE12969.1 type II toxin-antitoxin system VapC family toxin [Jiangella asiatica]